MEIYKSCSRLIEILTYKETRSSRPVLSCGNAWRFFKSFYKLIISPLQYQVLLRTWFVRGPSHGMVFVTIFNAISLLRYIRTFVNFQPSISMFSSPWIKLEENLTDLSKWKECKHDLCNQKLSLLTETKKLSGKGFYSRCKVCSK